MTQKINDSTDSVILGRLIPKSNKIHQNQEVLSICGVGITLKSTDYKNPPKILVLCDMEVGGQRGRVFSNQGIIGALSATDWKDAPKCVVKEIVKKDDNE